MIELKCCCLLISTGISCCASPVCLAPSSARCYKKKVLWPRSKSEGYWSVVHFLFIRGAFMGYGCNIEMGGFMILRGFCEAE